ncbi:hypothetical protein HMPREF0083_04788 [Aneurinibacillus aneurinilyticus ATCC 12856]|uniref:Uncharacterized protein n=1 Tax=Aneurinibacillus aneurinilyticus ATCC 12856 TaxID=649747 RepID=U1WWT4_ANEAE|nr:hypothetical protein HMPREF0083_04788 [Aneurinibacillus aneurinilyticus ATCC 12856]
MHLISSDIWIINRCGNLYNIPIQYPSEVLFSIAKHSIILVFLVF